MCRIRTFTISIHFLSLLCTRLVVNRFTAFHHSASGAVVVAAAVTAAAAAGYMNYVYLPNVFYIDILQNIIFFRSAAAAVAVATTAAVVIAVCYTSRVLLLQLLLLVALVFFRIRCVVHFIHTFVSRNECEKKKEYTH